MQYNVYGIEVQSTGARITFGWSDPDFCWISLDMLEEVVAAYLRL